MKALIYSQPLTIEYSEVTKPEPQAGEVLVAVKAAGICGSDLHAFQGHDERRQPPLILGHEACGIAQNTSLKGQRVVINPLITCGQCLLCLTDQSHLCEQRDIIGMRRAGAFAEYVCIPERNVFPIADTVTNLQAALAEPAATAYHAIKQAQRLSQRPFSEQNILIIGGGAIGILSVFLLSSYGADQLTLVQRNALKRETLKPQLPCPVVDDENKSLKKPQFDLVIDAVGSVSSRKLGSRAVKSGGTMIHVGLTSAENGLDVRKFTLQEIIFSGVYCYSTADFNNTLSAITRGAFGSMQWAEVRGLKEGPGAFADLFHKKTPSSKIVLSL